MLSLRDGMGSGWVGKFFRRRRRRPRGEGVKIAKTLCFFKGKYAKILKHTYIPENQKIGFSEIEMGTSR